jgi:MFS family permease
MQLYAAFYAQGYKKVLSALKIIFIFRFITWFSIGVSIFFFGTTNPTLTLWLFGLGLFLFSFSAGFGTVYFSELMGKSFSNEYRGKTIAYRQFFSGISAILSGGISAWVLKNFDKPDSFVILFIVSAFVMGLGYLFVCLIKEFPKEEITKRENTFVGFLKNSLHILKEDKLLKYQIYTRLISYSYLLIFPFIGIKAIKDLHLSEAYAALFAFLLISGAMLSNIFWGKLSGKGKNSLIAKLSFVLMIFSMILILFSNNLLMFSAVFVITGAAADGFKLSYMNLIFLISPQEKRPVYIAIQNNITSLGMFFSIPGGAILNYFGYTYLLIAIIIILIIGLFLSFRLKG